MGSSRLLKTPEQLYICDLFANFSTINIQYKPKINRWL